MTEPSDEQIRMYVLDTLRRERAKCMRQADGCRNAQALRDDAAWADGCVRYVAEFDRAIAAVEREFGVKP